MNDATGTTPPTIARPLHESRKRATRRRPPWKVRDSGRRARTPPSGVSAGDAAVRVRGRRRARAGGRPTVGVDAFVDAGAGRRARRRGGVIKKRLVDKALVVATACGAATARGSG